MRFEDGRGSYEIFHEDPPPNYQDLLGPSEIISEHWYLGPPDWRAVVITRDTLVNDLLRHVAKPKIVYIQFEQDEDCSDRICPASVALNPGDRLVVCNKATIFQQVSY